MPHQGSSRCTSPGDACPLPISPEGFPPPHGGAGVRIGRIGAHLFAMPLPRVKLPLRDDVRIDAPRCHPRGKCLQRLGRKGNGSPVQGEKAGARSQVEPGRREHHLAPTPGLDTHGSRAVGGEDLDLLSVERVDGQEDP